MPEPALSSTLATLNAANRFIQVELGAPASADWYPFTALVDSNSFAAFAERIAQSYEIENGRFVKMRVHTYATWIMALLGVGSFMADQRLPDISLENLRFHWGDKGWVDRVALANPRFYALPTDSAVNDPAVTVLPDVDALRSNLRQQLETSVGELIAPFKANIGVGQRALWSTAADQCVSVLLESLRVLNQTDRCAHEVAALVQAPGSPLKGKSDVLWVEHADQQVPFLKRGACCFAYDIKDYGYCSTCPLRPLEERQQILSNWLAEQAAKAAS